MTSNINTGVRNPNGFLWVGAAPLFLAAVPITSFITQEGGLVQKLVNGVVSLIPGTVAKDRTIPALSAFYIFVTFAASGAASVAGQAASRDDGLDNNTPRSHVNNLIGLPLRLRSAHYNLMEMFPGFALSAALAQVIAPTNQAVINVLGLHVLLKTFLFYPAYLLDIAPPRSLAHILATGAVINAAYQLATGAS